MEIGLSGLILISQNDSEIKLLSGQMHSWNKGVEEASLKAKVNLQSEQKLPNAMKNSRNKLVVWVPECSEDDEQ